jgi:hypothetical protein
VTTILDIDSTDDGDDIVFSGNVCVGGWHSTQGAVHIGGAVERILVEGNIFSQRNATGLVAVRVVDGAGTSGFIVNNRIDIQQSGTASTSGITFSGNTFHHVKCCENYTVDESGRSGIISPVVAT